MEKKNKITFQKPGGQKNTLKANWTISLGLALVMVFFIGSGLIGYSNIRMIRLNTDRVVQTHEMLIGLDDVLSTVKDAETGQRGYLLTGRDSYLEPFNAALAELPPRLDVLKKLIEGAPRFMALMSDIERHVNNKFAELQQTITLRQSAGARAALDVVLTDRGKKEMDALRSDINAMRAEVRTLRDDALAEMAMANRIAIGSGILTALLGAILAAIIGYLVQRGIAVKQRKEWLQSGQVGMSFAMAGEHKIEKLGSDILRFLANYLHAHAGAFYARQEGVYRRVASYGVAQDGNMPERFIEGETLLGQAAEEKRVFFLHDVPDDYLVMASALGQGKPRHLLIFPAVSENMAEAVLEIGFIHAPEGPIEEFIALISESISIAVRAATYRANLQNMLEETQRQSEELQVQSEELRVINEEMEEQSRILRESQDQLQQQQVEMEQTNAQLEEQTQLLETQKDHLNSAKETLEAKAQELEQASQYKSDFLANMSHELRTPLNSSLILAKLLADNAGGNLTDEQVKFAQTIQSSGNDLLVLINDILDLSKIEAGHIDILPGPMSFSRLRDDLQRVFAPVAHEKGLGFGITIAASCPEAMETDRQRLEQILKNLLSNAFKFTETGRVDLAITCAADGQVDFSVTDTGIGIAAENQQTIFEAFRQADGTTSRKYGGTGLGLSISRQLARLLGGRIHLSSGMNKGSTFTLRLPQTFDPARVQKDASPRPPENGAPAKKDTPAEAIKASPFIPDDRDKITASSRAILIVEDDPSFAHILLDLVRELDFLALTVATAEDALIMVRQYLPSAVILDVRLPDHSGLFVLDRMKADPRTRHIPVHVVSSSDAAQTALSLGAVGYMMKPVKREELTSALKNLETRLARHMRRVLIVEDDAVQRESLQKLLGTKDVETVCAANASQCLMLLKENTFDCMVLDLSLPDASGYSLLETISAEEAYSFPPVIVYTGRSLSVEQEQSLRRYSKSIIIKGAKSPERLLDEVTLFLHQVVSDLPPEQQNMLRQARNRDTILENRRILVVEDDVRNVYALTNIFEPRGVAVNIARNGKEALAALEKSGQDSAAAIDLILMDAMMPEMDGFTAIQEIRKNPEWKKIPIIMLTAKAMRSDQERCLAAGANDYMAKPIDVEKLLSLTRVWMPR